MNEYQLVNRTCAVCNNDNFKIIGIRGNHEYIEADKTVLPHIFTKVVRCKTCDFIYTNPEIRGLEYLERDHYSDAGNYMKEMMDTLNPMFSKRIQFIKKYVLAGTKNLLDIGSGKGEFLRQASLEGFSSTGIEPSVKFYEYGKNHLKVNIFHGVLGEVGDIENKTYDIITMNHVLEHVDEPVSLLKKIHNYLNPESFLFIEVPNCNSYINQLADFFFRLKGLKWSSRLSPLHPPFHKYGYTSKSVKFLLHNSGYKCLAIKTFSGNDRSSFSKKGWKYRTAAFLSGVLSCFGNRELLCVIACNEKIK